MIIAVASGKGGTGKTTVATNLAISIGKARILDCDVEEPNANIFLNFDMEKKEDVNVLIPSIDKQKCTLCGDCVKACRYNALAMLPKDILLFPELCHGCGLCSMVCKYDAISEVPRKIGEILYGKNEEIELYQGLLNIGEAMATPIIKELKKYSNEMTIIDAPPGNACPTMEAIIDSDFVILVTEPTPFGLHDLKIAVSIVRKFGIPFGVVINKYGIGDDGVERYCEQEGIRIMMKIPHSREIANLYSRGIPFVEKMDGWKERFIELYEEIKNETGGNS
jgi:MinD superfamily P-loop ATPase